MGYLWKKCKEKNDFDIDLSRFCGILLFDFFFVNHLRKGFLS